MSFIRRAGLAAIITVATAAPGARAHAQTAADINRLNAAMQICNSPMGAGMAECAKLGAMTGRAGGGGAGAAAGLLGSLMGGSKAAAPALRAPGVDMAALQQAYVGCVQNAGGNAQVMQACSSILTAGMGQGPAAAPAGSMAGPQDAAAVTYDAGLNYRACAAANPANWQACLSHMTPGAGAAPEAAAGGGLGGAASGLLGVLGR